MPLPSLICAVSVCEHGPRGPPLEVWAYGVSPVKWCASPNTASATCHFLVCLARLVLAHFVGHAFRPHNSLVLLVLHPAIPRRTPCECLCNCAATIIPMFLSHPRHTRWQLPPFPPNRHFLDARHSRRHHRLRGPHCHAPLPQPPPSIHRSWPAHGLQLSRRSSSEQAHSVCGGYSSWSVHTTILIVDDNFFPPCTGLHNHVPAGAAYAFSPCQAKL